MIFRLRKYRKRDLEDKVFVFKVVVLEVIYIILIFSLLGRISYVI